jgi:hypothetical protein
MIPVLQKYSSKNGKTEKTQTVSLKDTANKRAKQLI